MTRSNWWTTTRMMQSKRKIVRGVSFYRFKTLLRVLFRLFFIVIIMNEIYFFQTVPM